VASANARLEVRPHGLHRGAASGFFDVRPGWYRVYAPDIDSLAVCRVPCRTAQVVALIESSTLTVRP
jgi:hypothetical protein